MKGLLPALLIISIVLMSGCVSDGNILNMAKNSPTIQEFLSEHPNAEINLQSMKKTDIEKDSDFNSRCTNVQAGDYYKVTVTDVSSGLNVFAFVDKNNGVVCAFKEGNVTCIESWSCSDWLPVICPSAQKQWRTCTDSNKCGTTSSKPAETRSCTYSDTQAAECTESWSCTAWSDCTGGMQTRTCTDSNNCGTTNNKPSVSQSCSVGCTESWSCSGWSDCSNNIQTRTCTDANNCGTTSNKPAISQSCTPGCTSHYEYKCYNNGVYWYDSCGNKESIIMDCSSSSLKCENGECVPKSCQEMGYSVCASSNECLGQILSGYGLNYPLVCCNGNCGSTMTCQGAGYTLCPDSGRCTGTYYSSSDSFSPQVCCKGTCDTTPTCNVAGGYLCYSSSWRKCTGTPIDTSDTTSYRVCCPSQAECVPKTCSEKNKNSCNDGQFCRIYNMAEFSVDNEAGQLCCSNACEDMPVCGDGVCGYSENKTSTSFTGVMCFSGNQPQMSCLIQGCPEDCV